MINPSLGFLGAGHMSCAIINGILTDEEANITAKQISATCLHKDRAIDVSEKFGINVHCDNEKLVAQSDIIILGVKPQQMQAVLSEIAAYDLDDKLFITIAAGIKLDDYRKILGDDAPIIRAMPNIAASSQAGLTGLYADVDLTDDEAQLIESLFSSVGSVAWLDDEIQIDGIIALSGSGLAFMFRFMQSMVKAGETFGFEQDELYDIVALTMMGAGTLALDAADEQASFANLCQQIAVEGGTTAEGLNILEKGKIDDIVADTLQATIRKSRDLGEQLTKDW